MFIRNAKLFIISSSTFLLPTLSQAEARPTENIPLFCNQDRPLIRQFDLPSQEEIDIKDVIYEFSDAFDLGLQTNRNANGKIVHSGKTLPQKYKFACEWFLDSLSLLNLTVIPGQSRFQIVPTRVALKTALPIIESIENAGATGQFVTKFYRAKNHSNKALQKMVHKHGATRIDAPENSDWLIIKGTGRSIQYMIQTLETLDQPYQSRLPEESQEGPEED